MTANVFTVTLTKRELGLILDALDCQMVDGDVDDDDRLDNEYLYRKLSDLMDKHLFG